MSLISNNLDIFLFFIMTALVISGYYLGKTVKHNELEAELRQSYYEQELLREVLTGKRTHPSGSASSAPRLRLVSE